MSSNNLWESILLIEIEVEWNYLCSIFPDCNYFKKKFMFIIHHLHKALQPFLVNEDADWKGMPTST